jgi:glucose/mannose-6-phosphate isomerase
LIELSDLQKFDIKKMYMAYDKWPELATNAYDFTYKKINFSEIDHIVFAGMGGSGTIGDIFSAIFSKTEIHITNVKGYLLPKTIDSKTLVITISVSGNTKETLTVLESASKMNCRVIAFSSGGQVEKFCLENNVEYRKIEKIHSPRVSLVNFLYSILKILEPILSIKPDDVVDSIKKMRKLRDLISSNNLNEKNDSLNIAKWITGIPMIYYPNGLQAAAIRFKNNLQENSKTHAITEDVVEACHNGIVAWEKSSNVQPILIEGTDDYVKTKERWEILKKYFDKNQIKYKEIFSVEGNILSKLINLIFLLDYVTIYHAVISEVDPSPVNSIDFIKSKL